MMGDDDKESADTESERGNEKEKRRPAKTYPKKK
jgi:hypothetical protein